MAIRTMPLASCAGGTATIDLRYDDITNLVVAIVVVNASGGAVSLTLTPPAGPGVPISRTWETGASETLVAPPNLPFDVDELGALSSRFGMTFSGPAAGV